jgi:hypothetical protein
MNIPPCRWHLALALWTTIALNLAQTETTCAADGWTDTRVAGPFVCHANFPLGNLAPLIEELAALQSDLVRYLEIPPASETIELCLFSDESSYRAYLSHYLPQVPYRRALYVKIGVRGMVFAFRSREFEVDLRHECTHALLHAALPMVPLWLDEGLAEYFEVPAADRAFRNRHLSTVRLLTPIGLTGHLAGLEKKDDLSELGSSDYRSCWAWVHFMLHGPYAAHDELIRFLGDIRNGSPPGLLSQRLPQRVPNLDHAFSTHFRSWKR